MDDKINKIGIWLLKALSCECKLIMAPYIGHASKHVLGYDWGGGGGGGGRRKVNIYKLMNNL